MTPFLSQAASVTVPASSDESLRVELAADVDPTAASPLFAVTDLAVNDPDGAVWLEGSWNGGPYGSAGHGWTYAYTPSLTEFDLKAAHTYVLWAKPTSGSEHPLLRVGHIIAT